MLSELILEELMLSELIDEPLLVGASPDLLIDVLDLLVGVGATTSVGGGATGEVGATTVGAGATGVVTSVGAGTIPLQQSKKIPSGVGQQSPTNPNIAHAGYDGQE